MFVGFCMLATTQVMGLLGWIPIPTWLVWVIWLILSLTVAVWLATGQIKITQAMKTAFFWLWTAGVVVGLIWFFATFGLVFETGAVAFALTLLTLWVGVFTMSDKIGGNLKIAYGYMTEELKAKQVFTFDEIERLLATKMNISGVQLTNLRMKVVKELLYRRAAKLSKDKTKITRN